ncbi:glutamate-rich protein 1 isoform X3 [Mixophyes fleayi]|uniref:glutamate-rich protein 1 isoform X3 n=1 Tax=Mixophyes fleayi TaxID=3061075 RepID=UPI003F4DC6D9
MSSARKEAFISKVLSKLYPRKDANSAAAKPPSIQLENALRLRETPVKVVKPPTAEGSDLKARDLEQEEHNRSVNAGLNHEQKRGSVVEKGSLSQQKIYTVSLPPDDYVPALQSDVKSSPTENSDLSEDLEGKSTCADSVFSTELIGEILDQIKGGAVPFSEVQSLNHLKRLLLLQDIERLKYELHSFKEHSSMPLDHTRALCSLFYYWITNILPIKAKHAV